MADEMDKNHEATPFKLMEARKKGQVAKSTELASFASLFAMLATILATLGVSAVFLAKTTAWWLSSAHTKANDLAYLWTHLLAYTTDLSRLVLAIVVAGLLSTVIITFIHVGPIFSGHPLKPDFNRINPSQGFKKIFALRSLVDLFRLIAKVIAFSWVAYAVISHHSPSILTTNHASMAFLLSGWREVFVTLTYACIGIFFVFAVFDIWFSRKDFSRQMKMSTREIKDEAKKREGDPEVKAKRKKALAELLKNSSSISNVKDSDVIITNPTHVAIALKYRTCSMAVPIVVAKGRGFLAEGIKRKARKHGIPTVRKPALARALLKSVHLNHPIPANLETDVARIYQWVVSMPNSRVFN